MAIGRYVIDSVVSRFTVRAFATGMLSSFGHSPTLAIRDFTGEAKFAPDTLEDASLQIRIKAGSLTVTDNISDKDRREMESTMNQEVLETARYPEIVFESSNVSANKGGNGQFWVNLVGDLSLHGVTGKQAISTQVEITGDMLRANGEFSLLQSDFKIKRPSVAAGALKVKDELKFTFNIVARKQPD